MGAAWASAAAFLAFPPGPGSLVPLLQAALAGRAGRGWAVALDWRLPRRGGCVDAVVATGGAVLAITMRERGHFAAPDRRAAEDAALDLADFHAGSRNLPIVPVLLVPNGAQPRQQLVLPIAGAASVVEASRLTLPPLLELVAGFPPVDADGVAWMGAEYAPMPGLIRAACDLYAGHGVQQLRAAGAGPAGVARARRAIAAAFRDARDRSAKLAVFLTGAPGAGKTLCGLDLAFGGEPASFLTANPTLVHVLREALVRDAVAGGLGRAAAVRRVGAVVQALPAFRDHYVATPDAPHERVIVIDEAQRCWDAAYAVAKTRKRPAALSQSEAAHLLDIAARRPGWSVLLCLVGGGQEIHDGEGGIASWGAALASRPAWEVWAPGEALAAADPRQRLPARSGLHLRAELHLADPLRANRAPDVAAWVNAVLADEPARARALALSGGAPFRLTRSLDAARTAVWPRGSRSAGLLASSTARRLRAEGLGAVLPHQDDQAVARWFLDRWPDLRSGDALEVVATEFAIQGLELDRALVCWDADLVRDGAGWRARRFRGSAWTRASPAAQANRLNAYRVLLTRARHGTVIWVPRGDGRDPTRDPACYDEVVAYLLHCGVQRLDDTQPIAESAPAPEPALW